MTEPYKNAAHAIDLRVEDLLARMTPAEKIAQLHALWLVLDEAGDHRMRTDSFTGGASGPVFERMRNGLGQITRPLGTRAIDARQRRARAQPPAEIPRRGNPARHSGVVARRMPVGHDGTGRHDVPLLARLSAPPGTRR